MLLDAERVYRELSTILEGEADLDFACIMVQVITYDNFIRKFTKKLKRFINGLAKMKCEMQ